jgi:general secretion pathway protein I
MSRNDGFTLIEVLIAMVMVVVGMVLLSQAFSAGLRAVSVADRSSQAQLLAEQKISELEVLSFSSLQTDSGDFGDDYPDYTWQTEVSSTDLDNMKKVILTVSWTHENTARSIVITRYFTDHGEDSSSASS